MMTATTSSTEYFRGNFSTLPRDQFPKSLPSVKLLLDESGPLKMTTAMTCSIASVRQTLPGDVFITAHADVARQISQRKREAMSSKFPYFGNKKTKVLHKRNKRGDSCRVYELKPGNVVNFALAILAIEGKGYRQCKICFR